MANLPQVDSDIVPAAVLLPPQILEQDQGLPQDQGSPGQKHWPCPTAAA